MRNIALVLVAILMVACNHSNNKKNYLHKENLKGKIKAIRETEYNAVLKFGEFTKGEKSTFGECKDEYTLYNEEGNIIEKKKYDCEGEVIRKSTYTYDNIKKTSEEKVYDFSGSFLAKSIYTYDEKGNLKSSDLYRNLDGVLVSKKMMSYDERGNMIEQKIYNSDGELQEKVINSYDNQRNMTQEKKYDVYGNIKAEFSMLYDEEGNMVERKGFFTSKSGKMSAKFLFKYEYDSHNNWIKKVIYVDEKKTTYPFDKLIERKIDYY